MDRFYFAVFGKNLPIPVLPLRMAQTFAALATFGGQPLVAVAAMMAGKIEMRAAACALQDCILIHMTAFDAAILALAGTGFCPWLRRWIIRCHCQSGIQFPFSTSIPARNYQDPLSRPANYAQDSCNQTSKE